MANEKNFDVLDAYSDGWAKGDSAKIYNYFSDSFTFSGMPDMPSIDKVSFKMFWVTFRSKIEDMGGPAAVSGQFMELNNTILRELGDSVVESGTWSVPKFGRGVYMYAARGGEVMWHEITMSPWGEEQAGKGESSTKDCISSLHTFVKK
eukprot:TRINITY_DN5626_c0_g1_i4.p1 TRINITY_DN5626_c0_g1~~TRINITY_DN5626_c0_g1_i4.p1  ORF type:complete len:149 (-),score=37.34 TRINITY_DN5626_c0_g1_i4:55-501(-)